MWKEENDTLTSDFKFKDFTHAFAFMSAVAIEAEKMNHHPSWENMYDKVSFKLSTHDAGDVVTEKDHKLADKIDQIYKSFNS